jgi:hypothetical protein
MKYIDIPIPNKTSPRRIEFRLLLNGEKMQKERA